MGLTARALQSSNPLPIKLKPRVIYSYITPKVYVKASERSAVGMVYRPTSFKGNSTIKNLLVSPKDKDPMANKSGTIYWFQCGDITCDDEYIGETSRTIGERFKEHLKEPSLIKHHSINTGDPTTQHNFQIIEREGNDIARTIKKSIHIRVNNPTLNRNIGKYNLHHI